MGTPVEAGTITGKINSKASAETAIPEGIPVVATGHDTQFAIFGSGAGKNQPVLSSGTWEILMVRSESFSREKNSSRWASQPNWTPDPDYIILATNGLLPEYLNGPGEIYMVILKMMFMKS